MCQAALHKATVVSFKLLDTQSKIRNTEQVQHEGLQLMFTHNIYFYGLKLNYKKKKRENAKTSP